VTDTKVQSSEVVHEVQESKGSYSQDQFISILFPIFALWYGPKYLMRGEVAKGVAILVIFVVEILVVFSLRAQ